MKFLLIFAALFSLSAVANPGPRDLELAEAYVKTVRREVLPGTAWYTLTNGERKMIADQVKREEETRRLIDSVIQKTAATDEAFNESYIAVERFLEDIGVHDNGDLAAALAKFPVESLPALNYSQRAYTKQPDLFSELTRVADALAVTVNSDSPQASFESIRLILEAYLLIGATSGDNYDRAHKAMTFHLISGLTLSLVASAGLGDHPYEFWAAQSMAVVQAVAAYINSSRRDSGGRAFLRPILSREISDRQLAKRARRYFWAYSAKRILPTLEQIGLESNIQKILAKISNLPGGANRGAVCEEILKK